MRLNLSLLSALVLALVVTLRGADGMQPAKPNIIFILVDDAGYGDLGCYGQKMFATPNLDRMAAEGMKFTRHYAGCTVCVPSRCVLLTGLHTGHCRDFARDLKPIFEAHCTGCHGAEKHKSDYRLDGKKTAFAGGESGNAAIVPAKADASPPKKSEAKLRKTWTPTMICVRGGLQPLRSG